MNLQREMRFVCHLFGWSDFLSVILILLSFKVGKTIFVMLAVLIFDLVQFVFLPERECRVRAIRICYVLCHAF